MRGLIFAAAGIVFYLSPMVLAAGAEEAPAGALSPNVNSSIERLRWLCAEIARHDDLYFKKAALEITDAEYDRLKQEMLALEKVFPNEARAPVGKLTPLGDDRSDQGFKSYRHLEPMLGLEKAYTEEELRAFHDRLKRVLGMTDLVFVVEPKFDGVAISVTYENGRLVRAVTRGNGQEGDDVTANVLAIASLPRELRALSEDEKRNPIPDVVELRGEVFLDYAEFARINDEREEMGEVPFAHPRNLAAGTLKQHDPRDVAKRRLSVVFYGVGAWQGAEELPASQQALHALVRAWGLPGIIDYCRVAGGADEVWAAVTRIGTQRRALAFPTDGAVVKLDALALQRRLGSSDEAPRWAVAYKFPTERTSTRLRAITQQVGRTGVITPVAELDPVEIGGSTISRATLHNADEIARRDLRIGDFVYLEKAGEIIPTITGFDPARRSAESEVFVFPTTCAACETALVRESGEAVTRCPNRRCVAQVRRRIEHFVGPVGVGIEGMGPKLIEALVDAGKLGDVADLYRLGRGDLTDAGKLSKARATQLLTRIERSKRTDLGRLVNALGIPGVGRKTADALAKRYGSLTALVQADDTGWGDEVRVLITELISLGVNPKRAVTMRTKATGPLSGKTVALTGTLPSWSRDEAVKRITVAGGRVVGSVSKRTDLLVAGEGAGAKLVEARALGITVVDERELGRWLDESSVK